MDVFDGEAGPVHRQANRGVGAGGPGPDLDDVDPEHDRDDQHQGHGGAHPGPDHALGGGLADPTFRLGARPKRLGQVFAGQFGHRALEEILFLDLRLEVLLDRQGAFFR